jgi:hypothetical protein
MNLKLEQREQFIKKRSLSLTKSQNRDVQNFCKRTGVKFSDLARHAILNTIYNDKGNACDN